MTLTDLSTVGKLFVKRQSWITAAMNRWSFTSSAGSGKDDGSESSLQVLTAVLFHFSHPVDSDT